MKFLEFIGLVADIKESLDGIKIVGFEEELYLPEIHKDFCLKEHLIQVEEALLQKALDMADGKKAQAARLLGITAQNFSAKWNKMRDRKEIRNERRRTVQVL